MSEMSNEEAARMLEFPISFWSSDPNASPNEYRIALTKGAAALRENPQLKEELERLERWKNGVIVFCHKHHPTHNEVLLEMDRLEA